MKNLTIQEITLLFYSVMGIAFLKISNISPICAQFSDIWKNNNKCYEPLNSYDISLHVCRGNVDWNKAFQCNPCISLFKSVTITYNYNN